MLNCWRDAEVGDPKVFAAAVVKILASYPAHVVMAVTDITTGLPVQLKWFPTLHEVKAACEKVIDEERKASERARRRVQPKDNFIPATEDERTRAVETWNRMKAEMQLERLEKAKERSRADDAAFLADCLASGGALKDITLSPDLLETLGKDGRR